MSDLDTLARNATQELLERSAPDVPTRYAELRRIRTRRTAAKLVAVSAAVALCAGGIISVREQPVEPAPQPGRRNGVLLAQPAPTSSTTAWRAVEGDRPAHLPEDASRRARYQFTSSGSEIVYADRQARISAVELDTGRKRTIASCGDEFCASAALSPDGRTLAYTDGTQVRLQAVGAPGSEPLATVSGASGPPAWSPDGSLLAVPASTGLFVVSVESGEVSLTWPSPSSSTVVGPVSWSPAGDQVAFFMGEPVQRRGYEVTAFTAVAVDLEGRTLTRLLDAGQCLCGGLTPPTLTWSPDGTVIAVATTKSSELPWGVYLVRPDGTGPELLAAGSFVQLVWQPLTG